jgi:DNA-damage-inducible protein J
MAQVNIRIDDAVKEQAERLFSDLGMNFSTAVNVFVKQSVRQGGLPFAVTTEVDALYTRANMERLAHSISQMERGQVIHKSIEDLDSISCE